MAYEIGTHIRELGKGIGKGLVVGVFLWDRTLFWGATPGSTSTNWHWATPQGQPRQGDVQVELSSGARARRQARGCSSRNGAWSPTEYALAGGAFPIRVKSVGIIGAVAVSGLHERDDHEFARSAIARSLGLAADAFALPPAPDNEALTLQAALVGVRLTVSQACGTPCRDGDLIETRLHTA